MLVKHVKDVDIEDEFIRVSENDTVFDVASKMETTNPCEIESHDVICSPILAAYVMDGDKPIGIITKDEIIEEIVINGKDPKKLFAKDIMKAPICCNLTQDVMDAVNLIIDKGLLTIAVCDGDKLVSVISVFDAIYLDDNNDD